MKTIHFAVLASIGMLFALWCTVVPNRYAAPQSGSIEQMRLAQCPGNSTLNGKLCSCPDATSWSGDACMQVWSSSSRAEVPVAPPAPADSTVAFARQRVPSLPVDVATWKGKVKAINSSLPQAGNVAMIEVADGEEADCGRVAIVESVGQRRLTIIEGALDGSVARRTASGRDLFEAERQLRIVGYYAP